MSGNRPRGHIRRRSSVSSDSDSEGLVVVTPPADSVPQIMGPPGRIRVQSNPQQPRHQRNASISGLPLNIAPPPSAGPYRTAFPASPLRNSFGHTRTRSFSSPFSPPLPSPLSTSTSFADQMRLPTSQSAPSQSDVEPPKSPLSPQSRRHSRIHSRNLSVFFPRPGALPQSTIDEDGAQELEVPPTLGAGFTFGKTPPGVEPDPAPPLTPSSSATRRGHHHKHSVSHTFFSFLEPQNQALVTQPTPTPVSPWMPISPFVGETHKPTHEVHEPRPAPTPFLAAATAQFLLGGTLWVQGQQTGSLAVTALGYWAVFDAMGVAIPHLTLVVSKPYAAARTLPVLLFAQSVYLMFSAVYVCKEALEHLLLSASAGDGHHHHAGDEAAGIDFPVLTTFSRSLPSHSPHSHLTITRVSSRSRATASRPCASSLSEPPAYNTTPPPDPTAPPCPILLTATVAPPIHHRMLDLGAAGVGSAATFAAAYRACTVLGAAFLRAMRDVERHPQVLHLPAPHIWQLAATTGGEKAMGAADERDALVVTLELHVRAALPDDDVLVLTRWVRERIVAALGMGGGDARGPGRGEAEVTVGIVRG
ncbi:hypothetical protein C8R46DRAFT_1054280 [Mycena filopes]|nr:hypothetical protein C8R46DRAFT_1054280 [Mycena filopes]